MSDLCLQVHHKADEKRGTSEHAPTQLLEHMDEMEDEMLRTSELVQKIEDAVDAVAAADTGFVALETFDEGGGELIPRNFASSIVQFTRKMEDAGKGMPEMRRHMLDGMAKRFTAGVILAGAQSAMEAMKKELAGYDDDADAEDEGDEVSTM